MSAVLAQSPQGTAVVVTGSYTPIPLEEADRSVRSFSAEDLHLVVNSFADLLRLDPSLDLRARAPNGVQSDLSIRGAGFGQTLVLLDGIRFNDVQSGHHNLDIPVPLDGVTRIEVLKGSGSTLYGSDAIGGVINLITRPPEETVMRFRAAVGNFGVNQQQAALGWSRGRLTEQLTVSRDFSTGFMPNRDYRNLSMASQTYVRSALGASAITLAHNDRPFGAEAFYGNFNSWERTRGWFAAARQPLGERTLASVAFRRHTDLFVLYRDRPQVFTNRHAVEGWQAALRRWDELRPAMKVHYGIEGYRDAVVSNNLGRHNRARGAVYGALDVRALRRFSFTVGARDEVYGSGEHELSPSIGGGAWLSRWLKIRGSASRAFRLPTFTDLYYHDPANLGSPDLRPESAWSYEGGLDWYAGQRLRGELVVFQRREQDVIDYVRGSPNDIWRATNFQRLNFTGLEAGVQARFAAGQTLELQYTRLDGARSAVAGVFSKYVFNYPVHSGVASWLLIHKRSWHARVRVGAQERLGRDPYAVADLYGACRIGPFEPFAQLTNLSDTRYQEISGVPMPGRAFVVGLSFSPVGY